MEISSLRRLLDLVNRASYAAGSESFGQENEEDSTRMEDMNLEELRIFAQRQHEELKSLRSGADLVPQLQEEVCVCVCVWAGVLLIFLHDLQQPRPLIFRVPSVSWL